MKKFYTGICLLLLVVVMAAGVLTILIDGVPDIGINNFINGQYAAVFHDRIAGKLSDNEIFSQWNRYLNEFYTFTGFSEEDGPILVPIINDGADHGAIVPDLNIPTTNTTENRKTEDPMGTDVSRRDEEEEDTASSKTVELTEAVVEEDPMAEAFGQILLVGDRAMELPVTDYDAITAYSQAVSRISDALKDVNVYSLLVPNGAGLYAPKEYMQGDDSQENMIDYAYYTMNDSVTKVDAYSVLQEHKEEELYFRTDHHWTHLGSYYAYVAFCREAGWMPLSLGKFTTGKYETFLGTMYSFLSGYSQRDILRENPDSLTYYIPPTETTVRYYDSGSLYYGGEIDLFYPLQENYSNKYITFLGGDHPITVIQTECPEERVCLLVKESYGNAFASWLTSHYSTIICIDPREFNRTDKPSLDLKEFSERMGVDDCIILNYPLMINSTAYAAWLGRLVP